MTKKLNIFVFCLFLCSAFCLQLYAQNTTAQKHVLFIVQGGSHVHPTFDVVQKLIEKGNKVTYLSLDKESNDYRRLIKMGATVLNLTDEIWALNRHFTTEQQYVLKNPFMNYVDQPEGAADTSVLSHYFMALFWDELVELTKNIHPDVIVYDAYQGYWGKYAARKLSIPAFASYAPFLFSWNKPALKERIISEYKNNYPATPKRIWAVDHLQKTLGSIGHDIDVNVPIAFSDSDYATFIYTYSHLVQCTDSRVLDTNLIFAGYENSGQISLNETECHIVETISREKKDKKLIFVTMGTDSSKPREFFSMLGDALGNGPQNKGVNDTIMVALHPGDKIARREKYDAQEISRYMQSLGHTNFIVYDYFPLNYLLDREIDLFIGHGGYNSSIQALKCYTPMILLPIHGDQISIGEIFQKWNLAYTITDTINPMPYKENEAQWMQFTSNHKTRGAFVQWIRNTAHTILTDPYLQKEAPIRRKRIDALLQTEQGYEKIIQLIMSAQTPKMLEKGP